MLTIETEGRYRNKITLTKGDSAALKIKVRDARNKVLSLSDSDTAVLTIKMCIRDRFMRLSAILPTLPFIQW